MKTVCIVLIAFCAFVFLFTPPVLSNVFADEYQGIPQNTNPDVPHNLHTYTQSVMIEVATAFLCQLTGIDLIDPKHGCLDIDTATGKLGYISPQSPQNQMQVGGAIGLMGGLITYTYDIPVSTHDYISYLSANFGIAKPAYAQQGIGLKGLAPVFVIWEGFRNIVYFLFVIILVVIGLGIMFRIQIDPRTVMTVQNQIPKIIIGLLLVTFSYTIAGLLIDFMWVVVYLLFRVFSIMNKDIANMIDNVYNTPVGFANSMYNNPAGGILTIVTNAAKGIGDLIGTFINGAINAGGVGKLINTVLSITLLLPYTLGCIVKEGVQTSITPPFINFSNFSSAATHCAESGVGNLGGIIGGIFAFFIIAIAIFFTLLRLWFQLLKSYVFILLDVILAPFWIILGLIPGGGAGAGAWIRDLVANLAVFPATIAMFLLAKVIIDKFGAAPPGGIFVPPLIGNPNDPASSIAAIVGLGIILMTPAVVAIVRDAFKAPGFKHITTAGAMVGIGGAVVGGAVGGSLSRLTRVDQYGAPRGPLSILAYQARYESKNRAAKAFGRAAQFFTGFRPGYVRNPETKEYVRPSELPQPPTQGPAGQAPGGQQPPPQQPPTKGP